MGRAQRDDPVLHVVDGVEHGHCFLSAGPSLSRADEELDLSYSETLELLDTHRSIVARRSNRSVKELTVEDWKKLYNAVKKVFG
jgi:hypothetical protein